MVYKNIDGKYAKQLQAREGGKVRAWNVCPKVQGSL
jgi:hypothetical protein